MRPGLRLATSNVFGRRSRTMLLVAVVAMSAALIAAVSTGMASIEGALRKRMMSLVGSADVRVRPIASGTYFDTELATRAGAWPEVDVAIPRISAPITLRVVRPVWKTDPQAGDFVREIRSLSSTALGNSSEPGVERRLRPVDLVEGRLPEAPGEVVVSQVLLDRLRGQSGVAGRRSSRLSQITSQIAGVVGGATLPQGVDPGPQRAASADDADALNKSYDVQIGGTIEALRLLAPPIKLTIVGVSKSELFGGRPAAMFTFAGLGRVLGHSGKASEIEIILKKGQDAEAFVQRHTGDFKGWPESKNLLFQTTAKVTTGFKRNLQNNNVPLLVASGMAFLSAAFIIMTGMTVNISERKRELAVLRCLGASRWQVAEAQIWTGLGIGLVGAAIGIPLGLAIALSTLEYFKNDLKIEVFWPGWSLAGAGAGSVASALLGAAWPAWRAARQSPLEALTARATIPGRSGILLALLVGLVLVAMQPLPFFLGLSLDATVQLYVFAGLPCLLIGYFILGVPVVVGLTRLFAPVVGRLMGVQPLLLSRAIMATPWRHGLTAGAMMTGLGLMVAVRTQGRAIAEDWLGKIQFPEIFVTGSNLLPRHQRALEGLPFVTDTVAISLHSVESDAMSNGILAIDKTTFIAFEPVPFFKLTHLDFEQGDVTTATRRLEEGGCVIVAREFLNARGLGIGSTIRCGYEGRWQNFEIVGVVSSPGLDLVNQYFDLGQAFADTAVHAVFGSRKDLRDKLLGGVEPSTQLVQVGIKGAGTPGAVTDDEAEERVRAAMQDAGILDVGNGRKIKTDITAVIARSMLVTSVIAVISMLVACMGVANLIVAGIDARQFEFGVLRAVGARRGLVLRLVLAEAVLIALAAMILGTLIGLQAVWAGQRIDAMLIGIRLFVHPPWGPILMGCGVVLVLTVGAAAPAVIALARRTPRDLLAATRG